MKKQEELYKKMMVEQENFYKEKIASLEKFRDQLMQEKMES